jgi:hypothetical protein
MDGEERKIFYTHLIEKMLLNIQDVTLKLLNIPIENHPANIISRMLYIPPNQLRPDLRPVGGDKVANDQITSYIQIIIKTNEMIVPVTNDAIDITYTNLEKIKSLNMYLMNLAVGSPVVNNSYAKTNATIYINIRNNEIYGFGHASLSIENTFTSDIHNSNKHLVFEFFLAQKQD